MNTLIIFVAILTTNLS